MKLLHVTDFHGNKAWYEWLLSECASTAYDAIFLTGDLINLLGPCPFEEQIKVEEWAKSIRATGAKLFICSGNHDMWLDAGSWSWIKAQHGTFFLDNMTITSVPWLLVPWDIEGKQREFDLLQHQVRKVPQPWLALQHWPPLNSKAGYPSGPIHPDDIQYSLLDWEPDFLFCGHIHAPQEWTDTITSANQKTTHLFNPGVAPQENPYPNRIALDLNERTATWIGYDEQLKEQVETIQIQRRTRQQISNR